MIATGGLAELIAVHSETITAVDPELTLHGLRIVWERNRDEAGAASVRSPARGAGAKWLTAGGISLI